MSIKVMTWVWDNSPTKGTELLMLLAIADNAADDGANAFPSISTLARKTRLDERTVQRILRKLSDQGQLHIDKRGGREANRYTLLMGQQLSTPPAKRHPRQNATGGTAAAPGVAQPRHPTPGTAVPPEPPGTVLEPSTGSRAAESGKHEEAETDIDAVLDGLGGSWPLTPRQRERIAPKVVQALAAGWSSQRLAHYLGANPEGVKSPAAVLTARLDDLPEPVADTAPPQRPEWCGSCDEPSRTVERSDGRWARCPHCHPSNADPDSGRPKPPSTHRPEPSTPTDQETGRSDSSVPHER
ncbi:Helix-turn-helix domain-containing protein [Actinopolyspora mzabensis]|uniref:Helix-turn-helix domain-containing protein n=1 Tax=Actinopolyspora mzabensis TaxID=995066 RepID=A0A1G9CSD8_ACTMZ|nr:helix-turn-helix domain-containing protein [Actinopolyspora mzabensis]SDK54558.1 Helix-turn-helix domain-containing protein [Actinopolyspora mzabensis]